MAITERVEKIRQNYVNTKPHISYERAWSWIRLIFIRHQKR